MPDQTANQNEQWKGYKEKVLAKLTYQEVYGQIKSQKPSGDGWITGLCPFHNDSHNSFAFHTQTLKFCCFAGCGKGSAMDFIMLASGRGFKETLLELGDRLGISRPQSQSQAQAQAQRPPIKEDLIRKWQGNLNDELLRYLREGRGLSDETISKYQIGWDEKRQRYTIPVRDERGNLVNVRLYNSKKDPKIINYTEGKHKYGSPARLYGLDELVKYQGQQVAICEGEFDRLLLQQEGFVAVTGTHGCSTFRPEWVNYFAGKDVVIIFDCDKEGQAAVNSIVLKAFKGKVASVKNILLPLKGDKDDKDVTDYFHKRGLTGADLQKLIDETPAHIYKEDAPPEEVIPLKSFTEIEQKEYIDKKVQCEITVCGETSEAFHAVEEFKVTYCPKLKAGECFQCVEPIKIPMGAQEYIGSCMSTNIQLKAMLRDYCCKYGQKPAIDIIRRTTIKEFFCHQRVNRVIHVNDPKGKIGYFADSNKQELVEKKVYYVSSQDIGPGNYLATGYVKSHPKTQMVTFLIDTLIPQEDDFQAFHLEENLEHLRHLKKFTLHQIIEDITHNVIHIFKRDEMVLAMLLTYLSPRKLIFNQEEIRSWLITAVIGDTGVGKSTTYNRLAEFLDIGDTFSGLTGTRTGLAYALVEHPQKGWQVKIGRYPANHGRILCVDEVQHIPHRELLPLAKAMDEGFLQIDRVLSKGYECQTRMILLCNPKPHFKGNPIDQKDSNQTMDEFAFGCLALKDVFPYAFLRRIDIAVIANDSDIENTAMINACLSTQDGKITRQMLRALVYWAWNLRIDQIEFELSAQRLCNERAGELGRKYGEATDIPLVCKSDIKNNLARIAAAFAVLCISEENNFSRLVIKSNHVEAAMQFLNSLYSHDNCQLDDYSEFQRMRHRLHDYEGAKTEFLEIAQREKHDPEGKASFRKMVSYLRFYNLIRRDELAEMVGCGTDYISDMMRTLKKYEFIDSTREGYSKRPKFNRFLRRLLKEHPAFLKTGD